MCHGVKTKKAHMRSHTSIMQSVHPQADTHEYECGRSACWLKHTRKKLCSPVCLCLKDAFMKCLKCIFKNEHLSSVHKWPFDLWVCGDQNRDKRIISLLFDWGKNLHANVAQLPLKKCTLNTELSLLLTTKCLWNVSFDKPILGSCWLSFTLLYHAAFLYTQHTRQVCRWNRDPSCVLLPEASPCLNSGFKDTGCALQIQ